MPHRPDADRAWTDDFLDGLSPRVEPYDLADPGAPGLRLRVQPSGSKMFRWVVTSLGRVLTIGAWVHPRDAAKAGAGRVTLAEARSRLSALKNERKGQLLASAAERREKPQAFDVTCGVMPARGNVVYFVLAQDAGLLKIGTSDCAARRLQTLATMSPERLSLVGWVPGDGATEKALHRRFRALRSHGEWFRFEGALRRFVLGLSAAKEQRVRWDPSSSQLALPLVG